MVSDIADWLNRIGLGHFADASSPTASISTRYRR